MERDVRVMDGVDEHNVEAAPGDEVTVRLSENPATGFSWVNPEGCDVVASEYSPAAGSVSRAGERTVKFRVGDSPATVTFRLVRSWQPDAPARTVTLKIVPPR